MLPTSLFDYELPPELIARYPAERRDGSRMMVLDRITGETEIHPFSDILNYLSPGDAIICNNTKVCRGRMFARKGGNADGAKFEILLVEPHNGIPGEWNCMVKPGKRAKDGVHAVLLEQDGSLNAEGIGFTFINRNGDDTFHIRFDHSDDAAIQERFGHIPLPPYLNRDAEKEDNERYQTVYASRPGAVAAPTAGLHFTPEILTGAVNKGVAVAELTLHVGPGTFKPVSAEYAEEHKMHFEEFILPADVADLANTTRKRGSKVLAVGTTTVRVLESCCDSTGFLTPRSGRTDIFLHPPYKAVSADMLLTNFHLPCSTLLMLVSCFCEREMVIAAYRKAVENKMRFYSYGDCMLLK
ncbi:MAG: tRNA preQ1(34) S-adenosylmethionine ribosyltransferase-isomerase QueA [Lentisphaerae bacterium]|nr:tRNA preQ1(34) S-adenosylmethionine ribosyltransferase-isomerase QueA [Lentisphaerota bacterium]